MDDPELLNPFNGTVIGYVSNGGELLDADSLGQSDQFNLLINLGKDNDVKVSERVLIFALGPELTDPQTGDLLGHFEIVRGVGRVSSVQARMAIVTSSQTKTIQYPKPLAPLQSFLAAPPEYGVREDPAPFRMPKIGDYVRFI